ncbi:MAG: AAA family ATPase [Silvanigrellales bacterium]|jgi:Cdc6-like AAA superfamily ATPase|nr:AAA family ATPase [Silvanigrellales bacterium]
MSRPEQKVTGRTASIEGVTLQLSPEYTTPPRAWVTSEGDDLALRQLRAAWLRLADDDDPMNPRLVGKPGVGKTTLALTIAFELGRPVYLMQGTADTRPEDLIVTPVINDAKQISYVASPLVSACLRGGVCVLDEGNRMSEKSWASLAPLLDTRRYVDSIVAGVRIHAHPEFRFVATMNDDASVYDLPEYIQSRLSPQIQLDFPEPAAEAAILRQACPYLEDDVLMSLVGFLTIAHASEETHSVRDAIQIAKYAARRRVQEPSLGVTQALQEAVASVLGTEALAYLPEEPTHGPGGKGNGRLNLLRRVLRPVEE